MGKDDFHKIKKRERALRVSKEITKRSETWLLVCEGKQTEPNYFESLLEYANNKTAKKIKYKIEGTGRNTESLVGYVDNFFSYVDDLKINVNIPFGKIFVIFDKDSFKKEQFNNAIYTAQKKGYIPIWSNECIELWFLLHFIYFDSNITRAEYFSKLGHILGCSYQKNDDHFNMLDSEKNLKNATKNAKKLFANSENCTSFANKSPCTTVFFLIEEIEAYLGINF